MGKSLTRLNISWTSVLECYSTCYLSRLRDSESKSWSCYSRFTLSFLQMTRRKGSSLVHWPPYSLDSPNSLNVVLLGFKELLLSPMRCSRSNRLFEMTPSNKLIDVLSSVLCCLLESTEPLLCWLDSVPLTKNIATRTTAIIAETKTATRTITMI